ncbi:hypothetical protein VSO75_23070, partial [Escherichia coli]|nr:hypothetical protein [Escherichia coli]MEC4160902.1 hypothetical protein [Escherichia coli]MEC4232846.1 hypothetical protein [Escherichia coli]MEC4271348.1 hypothetical protein [Escherichia coli]
MEYFMKGKSALTLLLAGIFSCGTCQATGAEVTSESVFNILNSTGAATDKSYLSLNPDKYPNYRLLIHSAKLKNEGNDSNLLIVFYVQIMPDDFVMQLHR